LQKVLLSYMLPLLLPLLLLLRLLLLVNTVKCSITPP
jgi:hypothetical protein